jgi:hypothetical protein
MGNQHLILPIILHTVFDNCLPHKHLATFLHATMSWWKKSKNQTLRFAILKVAICPVESCDLWSSKLRFVKLKIAICQKLKIAICQVENCDFPPLVRKPPNNHTNFVVMTLLTYFQILWIFWSCQNHGGGIESREKFTYSCGWHFRKNRKFSFWPRYVKLLWMVWTLIFFRWIWFD